jgi:apolipoprotein N-acyltransferase
MSPSQSRSITISVKVGEDWPAELKARLEKYGIQQKEVAAEIGWDETQFSRLFRPGATSGKPQSPRLDTVVMIEAAIVKIRERSARKARKSKAAE